MALALCTPLLTRIRPSAFAPALSFLSSPVRAPRDVPAAAARAERALAIARRLRRQTCLTRGITRFVVLSRAGAPVELVFGVGKHEAGFDGHCWVELQRRPYLENEDPRGRFPEVFRIGPRRST